MTYRSVVDLVADGGVFSGGDLVLEVGGETVGEDDCDLHDLGSFFGGFIEFVECVDDFADFAGGQGTFV
jgi:hypothetical protein